MNMIIDAHTHVWLAGGREQWDIFVNECRANNVSQVIVSCLGASPYPSPAEIRAANAEAKQFDTFAKGLTHWLAYINPQNANWSEELDLCLREGAIGIKLWISLKDAAGSSARTGEVVELAARLQLPVLTHVFNRTDPSLPGEFDPGEFTALAEQFPDATLIAAHARGDWRRHLSVLRERAPNAYVDISGCYPEHGSTEQVVRLIGADRVIFGSDMIGRSISSQLAKVVFADLSEEDKELILWKNAAKVFKLDMNKIGKAGSPAPATLRSSSELPDFESDHFCFCGAWPFFDTQCGTSPVELNALLGKHGIRKAYTADLGSVYKPDADTANQRFLKSCAGCDRIAPLAIVNPTCRDWRLIIERLEGGFAGVFVSPYLHGWRLDDKAHLSLFKELAARAIPGWINTAFGDNRFRHSGQNCRNVSQEELLAFRDSAPANSYVFQGVDQPMVEALLATGDIRPNWKFEISRLTDISGALAGVVRKGGAPHLVHGSEFPLRDIREVAWAARRICSSRDP